MQKVCQLEKLTDLWLETFIYEKGVVIVIDKFIGFLSKIIQITLVVVLTALVLTVFSQVILRFFFRRGFPWIDELSRFLFVWVVFCGIAIATLHNSHMALDFLYGFFPKLKTVLNILYWVITFAFFVALTYFSAVYTKNNAQMISSALRIRYVYVYMILPITMGISSIFMLYRMKNFFKARKEMKT